jgi:NAD(P)-dependent dehydrogenase (short-subunit alcohol dehydrogenase family)
MMTGLELNDRTAIVTGAAKGMGRSHALVLAELGAAVVVNDVKAADDVVAEIRANGGTAVADSSDVSTVDGAENLVQTCVDAFGRVDSVVNNAGISIHTMFADLSPELLDKVMKINAYGPALVALAAWPHLTKSGTGRLVMIASEAAVTGLPTNPHYAMSKGAMLGLTKALAAEGDERGIKVNAVNPAAYTAMSSQQARSRLSRALGIDPNNEEELREGSARVVSALVAWLAHPDCTVSGEIFKAEAGQVARVAYALGKGIPGRGLTIDVVHERFPEILSLEEATTPPAFRASPPV